MTPWTARHDKALAALKADVEGLAAKYDELMLRIAGDVADDGEAPAPRRLRFIRGGAA
jgi:hypothetical protein